MYLRASRAGAPALEPLYAALAVLAAGSFTRMLRIPDTGCVTVPVVAAGCWQRRAAAVSVEAGEAAAEPVDSVWSGIGFVGTEPWRDWGRGNRWRRQGRQSRLARASSGAPSFPCSGPPTRCCAVRGPAISARWTLSWASACPRQASLGSTCAPGARMLVDLAWAWSRALLDPGNRSARLRTGAPRQSAPRCPARSRVLAPFDRCRTWNGFAQSLARSRIHEDVGGLAVAERRAAPG
jgi:hypothetical protein